MSQVIRDANVYFLPPTAEAPAPAHVPSRWRRLRLRLRRAMWRVRLVAAGVRLALRRPDDEPPLFVERRAQRPPARVIDFRSARARLRPFAPAP